MRPTLKHRIFILGISGVTFGVILPSVAGSWLSLTADTRRHIQIHSLTDKLTPLLESREIVTLEDALNASITSPYAKLNN